MVTKLENSNCDNTQIVTKLKKTQNLTKLNLLQNSNCDKTKKNKFLHKLNCDKSKLKMKKKTLECSLRKNILTP